MKGVLFLCVANSARSQMAEGLLRAAVQGSAPWPTVNLATGRLHTVRAFEIVRSFGRGAQQVHQHGVPREVPVAAHLKRPIAGRKHMTAP